MNGPNSEDLTIHIDAAQKRANLPDLGAHDRCPNCNGELTVGFGLAGGGYGTYTYCETCASVTSKSEELDV